MAELGSSLKAGPGLCSLSPLLSDTRVLPEVLFQAFLDGCLEEALGAEAGLDWLMEVAVKR